MRVGEPQRTGRGGLEIWKGSDGRTVARSAVAGRRQHGAPDPIPAAPECLAEETLVFANRTLHFTCNPLIRIAISNCDPNICEQTPTFYRYPLTSDRDYGSGSEYL